MDLRDHALEVAGVLRRHGFRALLAGGCVRDLLLGRSPKDYDVATDATPATVQKLFEQTYAVGAQFGVVVVLHEAHPFEVANFRSDGRYVDGRHPLQVRFGDEIEDARRRDFTINGLFLDPESGEVLDYVQGKTDIRAGIIRTIGDPRRRFEEDHLRLLRAIRFAAHLDFMLAPETAEAIRERADAIVSVSPERIREELARLLISDHPEKGLRLLHEQGLLSRILPEVEATVGVEQPRDFHPEGDVFTHVCLMLARMRRPSVELAMGVLLHDVGKPATFERLDRIRFNRHAEIGARIATEVCERLRFSRKQVERIEKLVADHMRFLNVRDMRESRLRRFLATEGFEEHLELHRLDCMSSHGRLDNYEFCVERLRSIAQERRLPRPLVTGHDLIEAGYAPGPVFATILEFAMDEQLEGRVRTRAEALELVRRTFSR